jgi:hypothetical protein
MADHQKDTRCTWLDSSMDSVKPGYVEGKNVTVDYQWLGSVDTYRIHKMKAARVTTAR